MSKATLLSTYSRISRDIDPWSKRGNAWASAVQNAGDTVRENGAAAVLDSYGVAADEWEDARELAEACAAIGSISMILGSADEWELTARDIKWFAARGVRG